MPTARQISSRRALRLALAGFIALCAYLALGAYVSHQPPTPIDRAVGQALLGYDLWLAYAGYRSGLFSTFMPLCVLTIVVAIFVREWRGRVAFAIVALISAWVISDRFKALFDRPRPEH